MTTEKPTTPGSYVTRDQHDEYVSALQSSQERHMRAVLTDPDLVERLAAEPSLIAKEAILREATAEVMRRWRADARELAERYGIPAEVAQALDPN
jgi:hypothetical protein